MDTQRHGQRDGCDSLPVAPMFLCWTGTGRRPLCGCHRSRLASALLGMQPEGWPLWPTHSASVPLWAGPRCLGLERGGRAWSIGHIDLSNRVPSNRFERPRFEQTPFLGLEREGEGMVEWPSQVIESSAVESIRMALIRADSCCRAATTAQTFPLDAKSTTADHIPSCNMSTSICGAVDMQVQPRWLKKTITDSCLYVHFLVLPVKYPSCIILCKNGSLQEWS